MAHGAPEGAAIEESGGQRRRTNIGDIGGPIWAPTARGHECSTIPAKSDECRRGSPGGGDCKIECTSRGQWT